MGGKLIAEGTPKILKTDYIKNPIFEIECDKVVDAMNLLTTQSFIDEISIFGNNLHLLVNERFKDQNQITSVLSENKIEVKRIDKIIPTLEDVFIHLLEKDNK